MSITRFRKPIKNSLHFWHTQEMLQIWDIIFGTIEIANVLPQVHQLLFSRIDDLHTRRNNSNEIKNTGHLCKTYQRSYCMLDKLLKKVFFAENTDGLQHLEYRYLMMLVSYEHQSQPVQSLPSVLGHFPDA